MIKTKRNSIDLKKLKGSTLIEAMVALIICISIFGIALSIILKTKDEEDLSLKLKAGLLQDELLANFDTTTASGIDSLKSGNLIIVQKVERSDSLSNLIQLCTEIRSLKGNLLSVRNYLLTESESDETSEDENN